MASPLGHSVVFSEMLKTYAKDAIIEGRFICHNFTPTKADTIEVWKGGILGHAVKSISVDDCPIVDSKTGERSVRFSATLLTVAEGERIGKAYHLKYWTVNRGKGYRMCFSHSTPFHIIGEDNVNQLEKKCSDSENTIRSQQELMSKNTEVKDLCKSCAELEERVRDYGAENRRLLDELNRSKGRVEELELKSSEEVLESREKTADQQVLITELNAIRSSFEAKLQLSSTSIAKVMSERRNIDFENKQLRNELKDMKVQCDSLQAKTQLMMTEIMDFDKIKLKNEFQIKTIGEELKELRNSLGEIDRQKREMSNEWKEREQSMANEWREKECLFETQMSHMRSRLAFASNENQKLLEQNTRIETKMDEIMNKHNYFETKSQTNDSITDCDKYLLDEMNGVFDD